MKIILSESQFDGLKTNLNEQVGILKGLFKLLGRTKIAQRIAKFLTGGEKVAIKSVVRGIENPNNYRTINGKGFVIADNNANISIDAINSMVDDIAYGRVTVEEALSNFPKKLKDGTDFRVFFNNIPKKAPIVKKVRVMSNPDVEKLLGPAGKDFKRKYANTSWHEPLNAGTYSGWKIHVYSDNIDEVAYLYEKLLPVAQKHNAGFKLAGGLNLESQFKNSIQIGKGVTIYVAPSTIKRNMVNSLVNDIKSAIGSYKSGGNIHGDKMITKNIGYRYEFSKPVNSSIGVDYATYKKLYTSNSQVPAYNIPNNPDIFK
jgi:hypothetical protein